MGEKTPDTDDSGIERRDILKGLGFGAVGLAGAGAATSVTAQDAQTPEPGNLSIDYVKVVPEAADPEVNQDTYVDRPWATADLVFGLDFKPQNNKDVLDGPIPIGYQFVVINQQTREPVTESFEEGRSRAFAGNIDVSASGGASGRETFSLSGLGPDQPDQPANEYFAVLTVTEYQGNLDPEIANDPFTVADRPPQQNGGDGNQTGTDNGTAGNGDEGTDGGGEGEGNGGGDTTTTTTTATGNQTDGNQSDENWPI